jgi:lysozyme family protein
MVRGLRLVAVGLVVVGLGVATLATAGAQTTITVSKQGVGASPPGSGLGTKAALDNPKCSADSVTGWGTFPFVTTTFGPFCVVPAPKNNGGATATGVTATTIKVVVAVPNDAQLATASSKPKNNATGAVSTFQNAFLDEWAPYKKFYESWGRNVEEVFITSSGDDEAAQRADAVKVKAEKPFAFIDGTPGGLPVLQTVVAADKIVTYGNSGVSYKDTIDQAPYRWGTTDSQAGAVMAAEWAGKQLVKGKAQWAGDTAMQTKPRTFGAVYNAATDINQFTSTFKKYGGKLATPALLYTTAGGFLGDATTAQQQAPTVVAKLKDAGITSVFLLTDSAMNKAMMAAAATQQYSPEWLTTAYNYADLLQLARGYDQTEWSHAFGLSGLAPYATSGTITPVSPWYWGTNLGTTTNFAVEPTAWLASGIQYAGPKLTAKTFQQGQFATPSRSGIAYGKTAGLPYDEYFRRGTTAGVFWYDAKTTGPAQVGGTIGQGVSWYVNNAKQYTAGSFPKETFKLFDQASSVDQLASPVFATGTPIPCTGCPSSGGPGTPAA